MSPVFPRSPSIRSSPTLFIFMNYVRVSSWTKVETIKSSTTTLFQDPRWGALSRGSLIHYVERPKPTWVPKCSYRRKANTDIWSVLECLKQVKVLNDLQLTPTIEFHRVSNSQCMNIHIKINIRLFPVRLDTDVEMFIFKYTSDCLLWIESEYRLYLRYFLDFNNVRFSSP